MLQFKWTGLEVGWVSVNWFKRLLSMCKEDGEVDTLDALEADPTVLLIY